MAKVYLVTHGEYSDYSVDCAFPTQELADAFCQRENGARSYAEYRVEEYDLLDALPEAWVPRCASALLRPDGTLVNVTFWDGGRSLGYEDPVEFRRERSDGDELRVIYHRSEDAARQALYDLAARVKAERAGV